MTTKLEFIQIISSFIKIGCCLAVGLVASLTYANWNVEALNQSEEETQIEKILLAQAKCWNDKDIVGFMQTYWKSEKLTFSGGGKTTRGWQATLDRYKAKYPPEKMGRLNFDNLETTILNPNSALVLGNWHLQFDGSKADGNFSLVLLKMDGIWKIIHDHSSTLEK